MGNEAAVLIASLIAGAVASVAGFGIGSILTPLLAVTVGMPVAVAAISIPHLFATLLRFWMLRREVDRRVLLHFGLLSATGGLAGALLHLVVSSTALIYIFAALLIFAGTSALTGFTRKMRFGIKTARLAGLLSGLFGGLVGNQGGIRSAALLGFGLERTQFVATATVIALIVDAARIPIYLVTFGAQLLPIIGLVVAATGATVVGTLAGKHILGRIPEAMFYRVVGALILGLGVFMLVQARTIN